MKTLGTVTMVVFLSAFAFGQLDGIPPFGAADVHEADAIDLSSLVPSLNVAVISKPGAIPFSVIWTNQQSCTITGTGSQRTLDCTHGARFRTFVPGLLGTTLTYTSQQVGCGLGYISKYSNWGVQSSDGLRVHPLHSAPVIYQSNSCGLTPTSFSNQVTSDGSGYTASCNGTYSNGGGCAGFTIVAKNGWSYSSGNATVTDPFGNTISCSPANGCPSGTITDSLGNSSFISTAVGVNSYTSTSPDYVQWSDTGGTARQISASYGSALTLSYPTTSPCPFTDSLNGHTFYPISQLAFPDGTSMSVTVEQGPGGVGTTTGRIGSFTLRTGDTVSYVYPPLCSTTGGTLTRTDADGTTTYTLAGVSGGVTTTTVLDPGQNKKVYTFLGEFLLGKDVYQNTGTVSSPAYTLLSSDTFCYNGNQTNCRTATTVGYPITQRDTYHTLGNMSTSSRTSETFDSYGNRTSITDYDFGASSYTTQTSTSYGSWNGSSCVAVGSNIVNLPCDVKTIDSASHTLAESRYTYSNKGFMTQAQKWSNGTTWLTTSASPSTNGTMASSTNLLGKTTIYSYAATGSGGCNGMLLTGTSVTVGTSTLTTGKTWDCNMGKLLTSTDENSNQSQFAYDLLGRPTSQSYPGTGQFTETYPSATTYTRNDSFGTTTYTVDGLARLIRTQRTDGSSYDTVSTQYTFNGPIFQTNTSLPCLTILNGDCTLTHFVQTDPLGRVTFSSTNNNEIVNTSFAQNDITTSLTPAPTGEHNKTTQSEYDGLGRVKSVCSLQTTGGTACGQVDGNSGILTAYSYASSTGLTSVTATRGSQQHMNYYEAAGRLIQSQTPEAGTTTYYWDSATNPCGWGAVTYTGQLVYMTDANGGQVCYQYDGLGRVIASTATYPVVSCKRYWYDTNAGFSGGPGTPTGYTGNNILGRLVEAESDDCTWPWSSSHELSDEWFSYDTGGRTTDVWENTPHSGGYYHTTAAYAQNGQLISIGGVPGKSTYTITLDTNGRPDSSKYGTTVVASNVNWNAGGQATEVDYGIGSDKDLYPRDPNTGLMVGWTFTIGASSETATLTWNPNHTLKTLAITDGFNTGGTQTCHFNPTDSANTGYDDVGRLVGVNCSNAGTTLWSQTYTYDQYDNFSKSGTTSWNQIYNSANNRIMGANYDLDGQLTYDLNNSYAWDGYHKMITANAGSSLGGCGGAGVTCVTYDAFGRAVEKNVGGTYTELLYSPVGLTGIMNGQTTNHLRVPVLGGSFLDVSGSEQIYHVDWLGSARIVSDLTSHAVASDTAYTPYGENYALFGASGALDFTGDCQDLYPGGNHYDTPNRQFDVGSGSRWLSPEPARASWNAYAYPTNPNSQVDPSGLAWLNDVFSDDDDRDKDLPDAPSATDQGKQNLLELLQPSGKLITANFYYFNGGWQSGSLTYGGRFVGFGMSQSFTWDPVNSAFRGAEKPGAWEGRPLAAAVFGGNNILENAAHSMNALTGIYVGGFGLGGAAAYAPGAIAWGIGHAYGLGASSVAVLGTYPAYTTLAEQMQATVFNLPDQLYDFLEFFGEGWTANEAFLDQIVATGKTISTTGGVVDYTRAFGAEVGYLYTTYGYQYVPTTGSVFPPQ